MRGAFDDAEITGWEGLEGTYLLPDFLPDFVDPPAKNPGLGPPSSQWTPSGQWNSEPNLERPAVAR